MVVRRAQRKPPSFPSEKENEVRRRMREKGKDKKEEFEDVGRQKGKEMFSCRKLSK